MVDDRTGSTTGRAKTLSQAATEASNGPGSERESAVPVEVENEEPLQVEVVASPGDGVAPAGAAASSGEARGLPRRPPTGAVREPSIRVEIDDDEGPVDVKMADQSEPMLVEVATPVKAKPRFVTKGEGTTREPTTTEEGDRVTAGQRLISGMWEISQSIISIAITAAVIYCQVKGITSETLNNAFFFVIATYLQRTNHVRIGGVGEKPIIDGEGIYRGR